MFLGEYFHSLDGKGRVVLPSTFRRAIGSEPCVVIKGQDEQLMVFTEEEFKTRAAHVTDRPNTRAGRQFQRTVFAGADLQGLDGSGRLLLKPDLRSFAGLEGGEEIAVVGLFDHIELWNKTAYLEDRAAGDESYLMEDE